MKIKILCDIEADVVDKEELESIQEFIDKDWSFKPIKKLWERIIKDNLKDICPKPVYDNKLIKVKTKYIDETNKIQKFQLGDIEYMIDDDYRYFESEVYKIELLDNGEYYYSTGDCDFSYEDIDDWVFESELFRDIHLENLMEGND